MRIFYTNNTTKTRIYDSNAKVSCQTFSCLIRLTNSHKHPHTLPMLCFMIESTGLLNCNFYHYEIILVRFSETKKLFLFFHTTPLDSCQFFCQFSIHFIHVLPAKKWVSLILEMMFVCQKHFHRVFSFDVINILLLLLYYYNFMSNAFDCFLCVPCIYNLRMI